MPCHPELLHPLGYQLNPVTSSRGYAWHDTLLGLAQFVGFFLIEDLPEVKLGAEKTYAQRQSIAA